MATLPSGFCCFCVVSSPELCEPNLAPCAGPEREPVLVRKALPARPLGKSSCRNEILVFLSGLLVPSYSGQAAFSLAGFCTREQLILKPPSVKERAGDRAASFVQQ